MKKFSTVYILLAFSLYCHSQNYTVSGNIVDAITFKPIPEVEVTINSGNYNTYTTTDGSFKFETDLKSGPYTLIIQKEGYLTQRLPILLEQKENLYFQTIPLEIDVTNQQMEIGLITLSDDQLNGDDDQADYNISGLLTATKDAFLNAAAYDFSATFFRPRGLDSEDGKILINNIEMNKLYSGRPQWANWGGLNDAQRNRVFTRGISASESTFGDLAGSTNIIMRASQYRKGGRVSYASSNRTYTGRFMASYNTGLDKNGWAFSTLISRRSGNEGYIDGTLYDANSVFISAEKKINEAHNLNLTTFYSANRRGRSTALTDEVYDLKGRKYNPNWGYLNGEQRNSRIREIKEPVIMLNHYWSLNDNTTLNTSIAYQFGKTANTRIENGGTRLVTTDEQESYVGGARNPAPNYYQNLPSYFLRDVNPTAVDYQNAYLAEEEFRENGQLNWNAMYAANTLATQQGGNSIYALQADVTNDKKFTFNSVFRSKMTENIVLNAGFNYLNLNNENYARLEDLLGGNNFLDIDSFAEDNYLTEGNLAQSDLQNRNRLVQQGDKYKYHYKIKAEDVNAFAQAQFKYSKIDFYVAAKIGYRFYQRTGLYENGYYPGNRSFGKSEPKKIGAFGLKTGATYKISGRQLVDINIANFTKAPGIRNTFSNSRQNNDLASGLSPERTYAIDASYIYRSPFAKLRLTGYYINKQDGNDLSFFYTQSAQGVDDGYAFVQEVVGDIDQINRGLELGGEMQILPTFKLKTAIALGEKFYNNNPHIYYTSDDIDGQLTFGNGKTNLKNYHIAGGPEQAYQIGFEYRDPDYWWVGATFNAFAKAYVDVSNLRRSDAFLLDSDGLPLNQYDDDTAKSLLQQEKLDSYNLINIVGGKSWRIGDYFVGFFATINNVLNTVYKTGGFEDSRISDYRGLLEEKERDTPLFGNRYFMGYGTTYYLNAYVRF
ncbi:carboxypeptidase-like regulatory domain-containing protein [Leeuwenhoekiella sp. A16]|uniref:carboxypeptidase-like regulatory domain-containing protein n=1 Tax=unclassified Leeuwenhoekiella TaxID=2615029 RepID=UPI003A80D2BF